MIEPVEFERVSVHGGHSGTYCNHASDSLDSVVQAYIRQNFSWVGITEHMPPVSDAFLFPEEIEEGLTQKAMADRFDRYMNHLKALKTQYRDELTILVAFETEMVKGSLEYAKLLREKYQPDYIVGSVHHVNESPIDMDQPTYDGLVDEMGGHIPLYLKYFSLQYEVIETLKPEVIGHFDLIRIFDADYPKHLSHPDVMAAMERNLELIRSQGAILDFNLAALNKGASEPYITRPLLEKVIDMGVKLAPGDDSHGVKFVGRHMERAFEILRSLGVKGPFPSPLDVKGA